MWKVLAVTGVLAAVVIFALLNGGSGPQGENSMHSSTPARMAGETAPADAQTATRGINSAAKYERPSRVTQSTTGTTVVLRGGVEPKPRD
jgi:hypothetical protein